MVETRQAHIYGDVLKRHGPLMEVPRVLTLDAAQWSLTLAFRLAADRGDPFPERPRLPSHPEIGS